MRRRAALLTGLVLVSAVLAGLAPAAGAERADEGPPEAAVPRIVGGAPAQPPWPFMVALLARGVPDARLAQFCGGTLVAPEWVLTAAHCVSGQAPSSIDVAVGDVDLNSAVRRTRVVEVVVHPGYEPATFESDVALLRLGSPVGGSPVALAEPGEASSWAPGTEALVLGWGATTTIGTGRPQTLLEARVPVQADPTCVSFYESFGAGFSPASMVCAGEIPAGAAPVPDACLGDSGGPLLVAQPGGWLQVGIVSYGPPAPAEPCGAGPTAYTEVAAFEGWIVATIGGPDPDGPVAVPRIAGPDRYATAVAFAQRWAGGVGAVVIASGEGFADALVAAPAASRWDGPILLTEPRTLPPVVAEELTRLRPQRIFVVGGPAAVSGEVAAELGAWAPVERVSGPDRYATAAEVSRRFFPAGLSPDYPAVMVASGEGFPDALSASSVSAAVPQNPVLLTRRDQLPSATSAELARLRPASVLLVGGAAAVSETVAGVLATQGSVRRYAGPDRYATAAEVATGLWSDAPLLFVASGQSYADALVAGAAGRPLLLVPREGLPDSVTDALFALRPTQVEVVGGVAAVSDATAAELGSLVAALAA